MKHFTGQRSRGLTLIEIMVVVVILGILGAMIIPNVIGRDDQARVVRAQNDLASIANALNIYKLDNFVYPSTDQGLEALVERPAGFPEAPNWAPSGYLPKMPQDPWNNPYQYVETGDGFELFTLGSDGAEGGEGYAADIYYSEL
jgi:general secretion pathway protein G